MPWDRKRLLGCVETIQLILGVADKFIYRKHVYLFTLSNPAVGKTVLTTVKWCCNTGDVPIPIKKTMDEQTFGKKLLFSLILYKRLQ